MKNRKKLTVVFFTLAIILALLTVSFAAYTSTSSAKRVVTVAGQKQYFTSDVLYEYSSDTDIQTRTISMAKGDDAKSFSVTLSNYLQGDKTKYDAKSISYDLTVELIDANGNKVSDAGVYKKLKVNNDSMTENPQSFNENKLSGGSAVDHVYYFSFTDDSLLNYRIKITARPTNRSEYRSLGRIIAFSVDSTTTNWSGNYIEAEKNAVETFNTLGMINYKISGQVEEDCVLSWDSSRVEIDQWFLESMNINSSQVQNDNGRKSVTLHLGSPNTSQQYTITFYRTYAGQDLNESWQKISQYITFKNSKQ